MDKYIDREATLKVICRKCNNEFSDEPCEPPDCFILEAVKSLPYIDAVPVVRCRECKHYEMGVCLKIYDDGAASRYAWQERKPDDFCSHGEQKEGAD